MYKKIIFSILFIFFLNLNIYSQDFDSFNISARHFNLILMTYQNMESRRIDLTEYRMLINIENNILYVHFYKPYPNPVMVSGSPLGYLTVIYEVDIPTERIIRTRYIR